MKWIDIEEEIVGEVNQTLGERFISKVRVSSNDDVAIETYEYGSVVYMNKDFFGPTVSSIHDVVKDTLYNNYLYVVSTEDKTLYEAVSE